MATKSRISIPKKEFVEEHENLVKILHKAGQHKEARAQAKELREVKKRGK